MVVAVVVVVLLVIMIVVVVGVCVPSSDVLLFDLALDVFLLELNVLFFLVETADVYLDLLNRGILLQSKSNLQQLL